jgi:hypothetical protein
MIVGLHRGASENPQISAVLLSDLAGGRFDFRQLHLNIIEGSGRAALLAENTAERLAWRSVAKCTSGTTCADNSLTKIKSNALGTQPG